MNDALQDLWKRQDEKIDTILRLELTNAKTSHFHSMTSALDRVRRTVWIELAIDVVALLVIGSFLGDHWRDPRYLVPALILHLCAIASLGACVGQLVAARGVDYAGPVVEAQRRLTRLRKLRVRASQWTLLVAPALWTPLLIVATKGLLGLDAYALFDRAWIVANIAFSIGFLALMVWTAHRYGDRLSRSPFVQRLADDLAGRNLREANAFAQRLAELERE